MFKMLLKFSLSYSVLQGIQKGAFFLLIPVIVANMSTDEYGIVSTVLMLTPLFTILFSLLLNASITRYYYKFKDTDQYREFLSTIINFQILFAVLIGVVLLFLGKSLFSYIIPDLAYHPYIVLIILISILQPTINSFMALLMVKQDLKNYAIFYNLYYLLQTILLLATVVFLKQREIGYISSLLIANILAFTFVLWSLRNDIIFVIKRKYLWESLKYSIPILPVDIGSLADSLVGRFYILLFIGVGSIGVYYVGLQISSIIALIGLAVNSAYVPIFLKLYEEGEINRKLYMLSDIIIYSIGLLTVLVIFLSHIFIQMAFDKDYSQILSCIIFLCAVSFMKSIYFIYTNILSLNLNLVRLKTYNILVGTVFNLFLSYYLTKYYGLIGAAISALLGFSLTTMLLIAVVRIKTDFMFSYKKQLSYFVYVLFTSLFLLENHLFDNVIKDNIIKIFIEVVLIVLFIFVMEYKHLRNKKYEYFSIKKRIF